MIGDRLFLPFQNKGSPTLVFCINRLSYDTTPTLGRDLPHKLTLRVCFRVHTPLSSPHYFFLVQKCQTDFSRINANYSFPPI